MRRTDTQGITDALSAQIPKAEEGGQASQVGSSVSTARPIMLLRVSAKLLALVVNFGLALAVALQNDVLSDRAIDDGILGFDCPLTAASLHLGSEAHGLLFGFEAVFPSISHGLMLELPGSRRLPHGLLDLIRMVYKDMTMLEFCGQVSSTLEWHPARLSAQRSMMFDLFGPRHSLLLVSGDVFLLSQLRIRSRLCCRLVFPGIFLHMLALAALFDDTSGFRLEAGKCMLITLWVGSVVGGMVVCCGTPGAHLGLVASLDPRHAVEPRLLARAVVVASAGATLMTKVQLWNIHGASLLS